MTIPTRRAGRPHASSRAMLEEAAGELFLEQGYAATSIADITQRAGVSRSSFFNYFGQKSDLLWAGFDELVERLRADLATDRPSDLATDSPTPAEPGSDRSRSPRIRAALLRLATDLPADHVALAFTQSDAMGLGDELRQATARRVLTVADALCAADAGLEPLHTRVAAIAWAGALIAAVQEWSRTGATRTSLPAVLERALTPVTTAFD